jgi:hypothetical protein
MNEIWNMLNLNCDAVMVSPEMAIDDWSKRRHFLWLIDFLGSSLWSLFLYLEKFCEFVIYEFNTCNNNPLILFSRKKLKQQKNLQPVVESPPLRISLLCSVRFGGGTVMEAWRRWNRDGRLKKENDRGREWREYAFFLCFFPELFDFVGRKLLEKMKELFMVLEKMNYFFFNEYSYVIY